MRALKPLHATKVLITLLAFLVSLAGYAQAGDRGKHHVKRPHHARHHEQRTDIQTRTYNADRGRFERRLVRRDWRHHDRRDDRRFARDHRRPDRHGRNRNRDGHPSNIGGDVYFGGISAWRDHGNGLYFRSEGRGYGAYDEDGDRDDYRRRGKIIYVTPSTVGQSCSYEAGVCVIRR